MPTERMTSAEREAYEYQQRRERERQEVRSELNRLDAATAPGRNAYNRLGDYVTWAVEYPALMRERATERKAPVWRFLCWASVIVGLFTLGPGFLLWLFLLLRAWVTSQPPSVPPGTPRS